MMASQVYGDLVKTENLEPSRIMIDRNETQNIFNSDS